MIGQASSAPISVAISARSSSVVEGTMRSTMVPGKATSFTHAPSSASRKDASLVTMRFTVAPLEGRLSQLITANGAMPAALSRASASTSMPGADFGAPGLARSCTISGWRWSSSPVAGSWQ
ncbi:hypothetical protein D9M68_882590 [compost metagenome]